MRRVLIVQKMVLYPGGNGADNGVDMAGWCPHPWVSCSLEDAPWALFDDFSRWGLLSGIGA